VRERERKNERMKNELYLAFSAIFKYKIQRTENKKKTEREREREKQKR